MENIGEFDLDHLIKTEYQNRHLKTHFVPGETNVPVTGKVFGEPELRAAVEASLDFWLTSGPYTETFESTFRVKKQLLVYARDFLIYLHQI